jgi:hypothetical protein
VALSILISSQPRDPEGPSGSSKCSSGYGCTAKDGREPGRSFALNKDVSPLICVKEQSVIPGKSPVAVWLR